MKPSRVTILIAASAVAITLFCTPATRSASSLVAVAQDATPRTVSGAVLDDKDQPVVGATVFLKNLKTKAIRSFNSVEKGHYYFAQVTKLNDFEMWAEKGDKKSAVKTISTWDTRPKMVADLKLK